MEYEYEEEDREGGQQDYDNQADEQAEWADPSAEEAQALTATSKPRGYYRTDKGKGKSYKGGKHDSRKGGKGPPKGKGAGQVRQGQRPWRSPCRHHFISKGCTKPIWWELKPRAPGWFPLRMTGAALSSWRT